ncbi:prephenate dehydrogenase [Flavobacteriaceae bacterium]|nr:prephenate dehydrogenase [Flavobacteriaceae bacterium]
MIAAIVGLGLIGGSLALELKKRLNYTVYGIDTNIDHCKKALSLGIVDQIIKTEELSKVDLVVLATPVNFLPNLANTVLNFINNEAIVFDMGSTKEKLCNSIENHEKRSNFVAVHPIAGTEYSGPEAAIYNLFDGKVNIVCDKHLSSVNAVSRVMEVFDSLNMRTVFMDSKEHDKHIAYVSHLSHISSFMLGKTVLEIEKSEKNIFDMAGSGFESTVRLAKSSPTMWSPILIENKENILSSLDEYIQNLQSFRNLIIEEDSEGLRKTMQDTNYIKEILNGIKK